MARKSGSVRTMDDIMKGSIPLPCHHCKRQHSFSGSKEMRKYIICECGHPIVLTDELMFYAKGEWWDELMRRNRSLSA